MPPPPAPRPLLPVIATAVSARLAPLFWMAPPPEDRPLVIVMPAMPTFEPSEFVLKIRRAALPLMVRHRAPGPTMVMFLLMNNSVDVRVIVDGQATRTGARGERAPASAWVVTVSVEPTFCTC